MDVVDFAYQVIEMNERIRDLEVENERAFGQLDPQRSYHP